MSKKTEIGLSDAIKDNIIPNNGSTGQLLTKSVSGYGWQDAPVSLPIQTDNAGKILTTDGATASWTTTLPSHTHTEDHIINLTTDLAAKAPLVSPALTGTPTTPTAAAGTNTTQIASTAFVTNAISNLDSLPIQTDNAGKVLTTNGTSASWTTSLPSHTHTEDHIINLTTDLAAKAPLVSPALTGTPTTPTAAAGTSTTQIASTAFVTNAISNLDSLPSQTGNSGKVLTTDGATASWGEVAGSVVLSALPTDTTSYPNGTIFIITG